VKATKTQDNYSNSSRYHTLSLSESSSVMEEFSCSSFNSTLLWHVCS